MIVITTARLRLRELEVEDTEAICALYTDPEVARYVTYRPATVEECRKDLVALLEWPSGTPRSHYHLAVTLANQDALIGWCSLDIISRSHAEAELGYALNRTYWGQGYMTEAVQALLSFGLTTPRLHRVFATYHSENHASERVLQKVGMQKEGLLCEHRWSNGRWRDSLLYALLVNAGEPPRFSEQPET
jgi:ribosomal-protein-alanine N-acetyltransferase